MGIFDFSPTSEGQSMESPFMRREEGERAHEDAVSEEEDLASEYTAPSIQEHELVVGMSNPDFIEQLTPSRGKKLTIKSEEVTTRRTEERSIEIDDESEPEMVERTFHVPLHEAIPRISHAETKVVETPKKSLAVSFASSVDEHHDSLLEMLSLHASLAMAEKYGLSPMEAAYVETVLQNDTHLSLEGKLEKLATLLDEKREGHKKLKSVLSLYKHFKEGIHSVKNIVHDIENLLDDKK